MIVVTQNTISAFVCSLSSFVISFTDEVTSPTVAQDIYCLMIS